MELKPGNFIKEENNIDTIAKQLRIANSRRIMVIGSPGSGKTVLSAKLADLTNLPLIHLDDLRWDKNWIRIPEQEFLMKLKSVVGKEEWIIDGNYMNYMSIRLERADTIIFLDIHTLICLYRVTFRAIKRITGDLSTLPKKVRADENYKPVFRFDPKFFDLVGNFKKKVRPQIIEMLEQVKMEKKVIIINTIKS